MSAHNTKVQAACDPCRFRKVKCDGSCPCSRCERMGFECAFNRDLRTRAARGRRISLLARQSEQCSPSAGLQSPQTGHYAHQFDGGNASNAAQNPPILGAPSADTVAARKIWPSQIRDEDVLRWVDVYLDRLYWTLPVVDRIYLQTQLMQRRHHEDPTFAALVLSLCCLALIQPIYSQESGSLPARERMVKDLLQEVVALQSSYDFGEHVGLDDVVILFFNFAALFNLGLHKAARLRLREAVECGWMLGLHRPETYLQLDSDFKKRRLSMFLILCVTERAVALQRNHHITFTGQNMCRMERILLELDSDTQLPPSGLFVQHSREASAMQGLIQLASLYDSVDEKIIPCWNGNCALTHESCVHFTMSSISNLHYSIVDALQAYRRSTDPAITTTSPIVSSTRRRRDPVILSQIQFADCFTLHQWLLLRLWASCLTHDLLKDTSEHEYMRPDFSVAIATSVIDQCEGLGDTVLEVHGVGMIERLHDIAMGIVMALQASGFPVTMESTERTNGILKRYHELLARLRGGAHPFLQALQIAEQSSGRDILLVPT